MIRRNIKVTVLAFIVGILFSASATAAVAASATSPWYYYGPYQGYYYQNQAKVSSGDGVWAYTYVENQSGISVPTGYMGAWAGLYNSAGQILKSSGNWYYNSSTAYAMYIPSETYYGSGTFYSKGYTAAYNGNGYNSFNTYMSPSINY